MSSLTVSAVVDEDGLTPANSFGNADGIGDSTQIGDAPTNSPTVTQALGIKWGADDNDDAADVAGIQDAPSGLADRSLTFTNANVAINGVSSLTSNGAAVSFERHRQRHQARRLRQFRRRRAIPPASGWCSKSPCPTRARARSPSRCATISTTRRPTSKTTSRSASTTPPRISDGDTATGSFIVTVDDDLPVVDLAPVTSASITLDETEGDADDIAVLPASIIAQATANGASLFANISDFGADGPADSNATVFSLVFNGTFDLTPIGIKDTATDEDIVIINNGGVFEGRTATTNLLVFTIAVDAGDGDITVTQHRAVKHGDPTDHDEADTPEIMDAGLISLKVALTDDDGDGAADSIELGSLIKFEDDGPTILGIQENGPFVAVGPNLIVNGSFEQGHGLTGANWEIYHAITGWTSGDNGTPGNPNDDIPFEVQTGGVGGLPAQSGTALVELDSDTEGNPSNSSVGDINQTSLTNAIIQQVVGGTVAGQTYEIKFWYAPRPGDGDDDSSSMTVLWNGVVVHTINSATAPAGWQEITLQLTATGPNSVLGFGGAGQANELGAFIDNVSLRATAVILDDENTDFGNDCNLANDIGIPGGPGDDGQGVVETGQILFNAGTDGLKSIALLPLVGFSGVYVDPASLQGTIYPIVTNWVAGQNAAGGTVGYEKGGTLLGTMNVPSVGLVTVFTVEVQSNGSYKFTLLEPLAHPGHDDPSTSPTVETSFEDNLQLNFTVVVTDGDNDTATSTLSVNVDDDSPVAIDEIAVNVAENAPTINGNVITNDLPGADGASLTHVQLPGSVNMVAITTGTEGPAGVYSFTVPNLGVYTFAANGAWTFNPNSNLNNPSGVDASFTYRLTDGDGDFDDAVQPITVTDGNNPTAGAITVALDEEAINSIGSNPSSGAEQDIDNLPFTAGSDDIVSFSSNLGDLVTEINGVAGDDLFWVQISNVQIIGYLDLAHTLPAIQLDLVLPTLPIPPGGSANVQVTATLLDNLPHANALGEQTFSLGHAYVIATDTDGDVATGTVEITVKDDVPTIALNGSTPSLVVDETTFTTDDTESFAGAFTIVSGADQPVSTVYALGFNAGATGLVDTATNQAVVLSLESGAVVGRTQVGGLEVFRVTVAANGDVTLDQSRAVVHSPDTGPNQSTGLSAANLVTLTATVTDTDGDQDAETLNIGQTLTFHDDAPSINVAKGDETAVLLTTQDADTIGSNTDMDTSGLFFGGYSPFRARRLAPTAASRRCRPLR